MLLAFDVGNTHTVLGLFEGPRLLGTFRVSTKPLETADEIGMKIRFFLEQHGARAETLRAAVVSSVVPAMTEMLKGAFARMSGAPKLLVIDSSWPFSFKIQAEPASSVGADRLVNAEAAVRDYGAPVIVLDSGTATTLCAVDASRAYLGGAILPGIEMSIEALVSKAAQLYKVELRAPARAIGRNTPEAIQSGVLYGYAAMMDGMVARFREELGEPRARVVATGGVSSRLQGLMRAETTADPELTLRGIRYLYETVS
jgi:type III pantothenate kinase